MVISGTNRDRDSMRTSHVGIHLCNSMDVKNKDFDKHMTEYEKIKAADLCYDNSDFNGHTEETCRL